MIRTSAEPHRQAWLAAGCCVLISAATLAAYSGSFSGPFVFDDVTTIRDNPTIRQLWPIWRALAPPPGQGLTSNGRPLVNLSLAINYAISGNAVWSYHVLNLSVHLLAGLTLFGVVRRTLARLGGPCSLALAVSLIWVLHPLQTESVTFIVQRAESMMGLFYLLTVYFFIRYAECGGAPVPPVNLSPAYRQPAPWLPADPVGAGAARGIWGLLAFTACLLGMATKEVMVSAPVMVLLYDRVFVTGTFREAWRRHRFVHASLFATWILLAAEVAATGNRGATAGFGSGVSWLPYALTQLTAIVHYLRLCFWPHPLTFDYGTGLITAAARVAPCAFVVAALASGTFLALFGHPSPAAAKLPLTPRGVRSFGFAGAWFFAILAPSSSVVPVATQVIAEHRMYLPLAAVVAVSVSGAYFWIRKIEMSRPPAPASPVRPSRLFIAAMLCVATVLGAATARRNRDYASELAVWSASTASYPGNPRNHSNLGYVLNELGEPEKAIPEFQAALRIDPRYGDAENNMGASYFRLGNLPESVVHFRTALGINPAMAGAHYNLGNSLVRLGSVDEGMAEFRESLRLDDTSPEAHYNYATSLVALGRVADAIPEFEEALKIRPDYTEARNNFATALLQTGKVDEALAQYKEVLAVNPRSATAHFNLANILVQKGAIDDALGHYRRAIAIQPNYAKAHCNLGSALAQQGHLREAIPEYREALRLNPRLSEASGNLARIEAYLQSNPP